MATVYLAISRGLGGFNKLVVLKQLRSEIASDPEFLPMLLEEARIAARINHPNVVQTNDIGFDGRAHYIAMEYLEGQTLYDITRRLAEQGRRLPLPLYLHILTQALRGLHFAHELTDYDGAPLSIVHRDMTPHNVFVTYEGIVKVLDFGIAKAADSKNETRSGTFKGKLRYIAPEQALGIPIDRRADVFAIGAMMWHALAGTRLWKDVTETDVLMQLAKGDIPSIATAAPESPSALTDICQRALARRPADRFATAAEMMEALETYAAQAREQVQPRELSQFVGQLFEERRAIVRAAIDQRMREGLSGTEIPVLSTGHSGRTTSGPSLPSLSGSRSLPNTSSGSSSSQGSSSPFASHSPSPSTPTSPIRRHAVGAIFGIAAAALAFGVYKMVGQPSAPPPAPVAVATVHAAAPSASVSAAPVPAPVKQAEKAHLRVTVTPATANIRLDGAAFSGDGPVARDGASHRLEIDAPGFKSESGYVVFDRDELAVTYTLAKKEASVRSPSRSKSKIAASAPVPEAAPSQAAAPSPSATPPSSSAPPPAHKRKPKTSLDSADPWK